MTYINENKATDILYGYSQYLFNLYGAHLANILRKMFYSYHYLNDYNDLESCQSIVWQALLNSVKYMIQNNKLDKEKVFYYLRKSIVQEGIKIIRHHRKKSHRTFHQVKFFSELEVNMPYDVADEIKDLNLLHWKLDKEIILKRIETLVYKLNKYDSLKKHFSKIQHYLDGKSYLWIKNQYTDLERIEFLRALSQFKNLVRKYKFGYL